MPCVCAVNTLTVCKFCPSVPGNPTRVTSHVIPLLVGVFLEHTARPRLNMNTTTKSNSAASNYPVEWTDELTVKGCLAIAKPKPHLSLKKRSYKNDYITQHTKYVKRVIFACLMTMRCATATCNSNF